jgi:SRSO17 transposase
VNTRKERLLIDRELYIPQKTWFADPDRCAEAGIPADLTFATRPQQVAAMIDRAVESGVPFDWFTADEELGQNPGLRDHLEKRSIAYVMAIPKNTEITAGDGQTRGSSIWLIGPVRCEATLAGHDSNTGPAA